MSARNFKFVSPGIFIEEIDNSQIPRLPARMGPLVIGRAERGPGMRPVICESFSQFVEIFGDPIPGGQGGDVWRDGNYTAPTYAAYAAQAWLKNNSPITFVRLLGEEHENKTKLIYKLCTDPGGDIPLWIIELANKKYLPQMLIDLETFAKNQ